MRDALLASISALTLPPNFLDLIIDQMGGTSKVRKVWFWGDSGMEQSDVHSKSSPAWFELMAMFRTSMLMWVRIARWFSDACCCMCTVKTPEIRQHWILDDACAVSTQEASAHLHKLLSRLLSTAADNGQLALLESLPLGFVINRREQVSTAIMLQSQQSMVTSYVCS